MLLPCDPGSFDRMYSPPKKPSSELPGRSRRSADEPAVARGIDDVRARNERKQPLHDGIGDRRALSVGGHQAVQIDFLPLPETLVDSEEKRMVASNRSADRSSELLPPERRRL